MRPINSVPGRFAGNGQRCSASVPRRSCKPTAVMEHLERIDGSSSPCARGSGLRPNPQGWDGNGKHWVHHPVHHLMHHLMHHQRCSAPSLQAAMKLQLSTHSLPRVPRCRREFGLERNANKSSHWQRWTSNVFHLHFLSCLLTYASSSYWTWLNLAAIWFCCHKWMESPIYFFLGRGYKQNSKIGLCFIFKDILLHYIFISKHINQVPNV